MRQILLLQKMHCSKYNCGSAAVSGDADPSAVYPQFLRVSGDELDGFGEVGCASGGLVLGRETEVDVENDASALNSVPAGEEALGFGLDQEPVSTVRENDRCRSAAERRFRADFEELDVDLRS